MSTMIRRAWRAYVAKVAQGCHTSLRTRCLATQNRRTRPRGSSSSDDDDYDTEGPPPEPTNPMLVIGAMGIGAFFAVGIAAVGVYGAFYMAAWTVANSSIFPKREPDDQESIDKAAKEINTFLKERFGWKSDEGDE